MYAHGSDSLERERLMLLGERGDNCRNKGLQETRVESKAQVEAFATHKKRHSSSLKYEKRQNPWVQVRVRQ